MAAQKLTTPPGNNGGTFLDFPLALTLDDLQADFAILGIPFGMPYDAASMANDQSTAPDIIRQTPAMIDIEYTRNHYDWDLDGHLFDGKEIEVVDCGNVVADSSDHKAHYRYAELAARKIFSSGAILIALGGDHGIPIPVMRALEVFEKPITLVHVDAHLDWSDDVNGETEGYSSPIRRTADGGPYYLTIDADGIDPTIMPAVVAQTPGGLDWIQTRKLIHGLVKKGRVVGMDLVEIAPKNDVGNTTMIHAERLICNFIGASIRAGHCG